MDAQRTFIMNKMPRKDEDSQYWIEENVFVISEIEERVRLSYFLL